MREGWLKAGGRTIRVGDAVKLDAIKCASCLFGKGRCRATDATTKKERHDKKGGLMQNALIPGQATAMDQCEVRAHGRLLNAAKKQLVGGTIFVDIASGRLKTYHQQSLGAADTIESKILCERDALHNGVMVQTHHTDNGVFKSKDFIAEITKHDQDLKFCGIGMHHQNGVAESSIRTVTQMAHTMMLHLALQWP